MNLLQESLDRKMDHLEKEVNDTLTNEVKKLTVYICGRLEMIEIIPEEDILDIFEELNSIKRNYELRIRAEVKEISLDLKIDLIHAIWRRTEKSLSSNFQSDRQNITGSKASVLETDSCYESICSERLVFTNGSSGKNSHENGVMSLDLNDELLEVKLWLLKRDTADKIQF